MHIQQTRQIRKGNEKKEYKRKIGKKRGGGEALIAEREGLARLIPKIAWKKTLMHHSRFVYLIKLLIHAQSTHNSHMSVYLSEPCPPDG